MFHGAVLILLASGLALGVPPGFVNIKEVAPSIVVEARYAGSHNFVGKVIAGYKANKCYLTRQAATALAEAQKEVASFGLTLKVYDCYRPQQAVDHFVRWAENLSDKAMKGEFYPEVPKTELFKQGYIAKKSGHSRGSTLDLTIVPLPVPNQPPFKGKLLDCRGPKEKRYADNSLDMGTGYDCFDEKSHTANPGIPPLARRNRLLLKATMEKQGFKNYSGEWWHFTLNDEPYKERFFNFPVE